MLSEILQSCQPYNARLIAVSKTKPAEQIQLLYDQGQRLFGENKVQEIQEKAPILPQDIEWHMIGHLQTNKVRALLPHVAMIHSADRWDLIDVIQKEASKSKKKIKALLQFKIAKEESKFGFDPISFPFSEVSDRLASYDHIEFCGVMGMASFTEDEHQIRSEFRSLKTIFDRIQAELSSDFTESFTEISMGMSADYQIALEEGATLIRIGSLLFGSRH